MSSFNCQSSQTKHIASARGEEIGKTTEMAEKSKQKTVVDEKPVIKADPAHNSFVYADSEEPIFHAKKIYLTKKGEVYVS